MVDVNDEDVQLCVVYFIDDAPVPRRANPPLSGPAGEFLASCRAWFRGEFIERGKHPATDRFIELAQCLLSTDGQLDRVGQPQPSRSAITESRLRRDSPRASSARRDQ